MGATLSAYKKHAAAYKVMAKDEDTDWTRKFLQGQKMAKAFLQGTPEKESPEMPTVPAPSTVSADSRQSWNKETGDKFLESVDLVFGTVDGSGSLLGLDFSFTIADPSLEDCPLIGCSTGFTKLCGYELEDVVGRNCRFLVDPVPAEQQDPHARQHAKEFCKAAMLGREYKMPADERKPMPPWMPKDSTGDEIVLMQTNARKDGSLFNNLIYMKVLELGAGAGQGHPYIIGCQVELKGGFEDLSRGWVHFAELESSMTKVKSELGSLFYISPARSLSEMSTAASSCQSQGCPGLADDVEEVSAQEEDADGRSNSKACELDPCSAFDPAEVRAWEAGRFKNVRKLSDAPRNQGAVHLMRDQLRNELVAIKQMPNSWLQGSHQDFMKTHPNEIEMPWHDISCTRYLNSVNFQYACTLEGVYRNHESTFVTSSLASHGDLFDIATSGLSPGTERERALAPIAFQLCSGMKQLHDMGIVHRDLSLENVLLTKKVCGDFEVKIIDYGMASTQRMFEHCVRGKPSYQAPEMHIEAAHDSFLTDMFSVGVVLYTVFLKDYPWMATEPSKCKRFAFCESKGFRAFCAKARARSVTSASVSSGFSESLMELLEGMVALDPEERLTFGEQHFPNRRSVWEEPWMKANRDSPASMPNARL